MGIIIGWYNDEKTTVLWTFSGTWTWKEYYQASEEIRVLIDTVEHTVDTIIDFRDAPGLPPGVPMQFNTVAKVHPRTGMMVIVGASHFIKLMIDMFKRFHREMAHKFPMVDTLEEARVLLGDLRHHDEVGGSKNA